MKNDLWKLATVMVVLTMLVPGLAMLLASCGPEEEEEVMLTPVSVDPTATPVPSLALSEVEGKTEEPVPAAPPTDTPAPSPAEGPVPPPAETEAGGLIDDFEGGDFDARWWSYEEGTISFACTPDQPGHASAQAMRLTFEIGAGGYAGCGTDVDPDQWGDARGLSFSWRADQPGLTVVVNLEMEDPSQTHPEAEGLTPFQAELQTPGEEWTPVTLAWNAFAKAGWVGEGGVEVLDPTRVVALYFDVHEEQSGSAWFDDLQLTGLEVAMPVPTLPPTDTPVPSPALSEVEGKTEEPAPPTAPPPQAGPVIDKWALWTGGTHLRGANIFQRRVYPELDGPEFMGPGPVGPPYTQEDFDRLAALGANYVNISHPGLFTETPPYTLDQNIQDHLENLLDMIAKADMFAVITFRTGPGRSAFWTWWGEDNVADPENGWFDPSYYNNSVWTDQAAQNAWADMWRYTAQRYKDHPIVVGYDLMCEPNSNEIWLDIWDPEEFYSNHGGTLYDWNQLYTRITTAIREVDSDTPILIGGMGYSAVAWLPYLQPTGDPRTVYAMHQYSPTEYMYQSPPLELTYPGELDLDWDGVADQFNRAWLEDLLSTVDDFAARHGVPVTVNEFGVMRWQPGAAEFMDDQMSLFEQRGMNYALWEWQTSWEPFAEEVHAWNFRFGSDPENRADVASSDLIEVIVKYWGRNTIWPSKPY